MLSQLLKPRISNWKLHGEVFYEHSGLGCFAFHPQVIHQTPVPHTLDNVVILEILQKMFLLGKTEESVVFHWIPGYTALPGNEATHAAAKEATLIRNLTLN
jgi:hypothetical protein